MRPHPPTIRPPATRPPHRAAGARPTLLAASLAAAFGTLAVPSAAAALPLPTGGQVVAGRATWSTPSPGSLEVRQGSERAAIDWTRFDIGRDAGVRFVQPSATSVVLNRVTGPDPSAILGRLEANGQVFLLNPNGVLFGRDARVDVAGLVASTANLRTDDFMSGRWRFGQPGRSGAEVVNEGHISVRDGGLAALVAPGVANRGTITARLGTVALASGQAFTLDPYGDRLIQWVVPDAQLARVVQSGTLSADGGSVQLSTRGAGALLDGVINLGGTVRARSVAERGGRIVLEGDAASRLSIDGSVDVTGLAAGERGGLVALAGGGIRLGGGARLDARGDAGGGTVHVGGGWQGAGASAAVASAAVERGALIDVSATGRGDAGTAVVWSHGGTRFEGRIDARGGAQGGDGGQVEVSGHRLAFDGQVDAAAGRGRAGTLLLDPDALVVQSRLAAPPASGTADVVTTESVNQQLAAGTSVQLAATTDLTVADRIDARLASAGGARLNRTGAGLTLTAGADLRLDADVILDGGSFTGSAGARIVQASPVVLATGGGNATLQAGNGITLGALVGVRDLALRTRAGSIELGAPVVLGGRFSADVMQAGATDRVRLAGLVASSPDALPAVQVNRAAGNSGAAAVQIDDHLLAAGAVSVQGSRITLADGRSIDTRVVSGGRSGAAVTLEAGAGGLVLDGAVRVDDAAVTLRSQGGLAQATGSVISSGSGAIDLSAAGAVRLSQVQTRGAVTVAGDGVRIDAGSTGTAVQAGTLQVQARGAAGSIDLSSSLRLGAGESVLAADGTITMQPGTLIEAGATGSLRLDAGGSLAIEHLRSGGAGVMLTSAHGDIDLRQALGGRPAGDTTSVTTLGGDTVPKPTLYALDARAPEGRIETRGLLLHGRDGDAPTLDLPAAGPLAYGLNLDAQVVTVRGLVFVLDGAVSIRGRQKLIVGNSIRSANGHAMFVGGGEIDLYRPTRPDGSPYRNTDIVVAQYADGSVHFFERIGGVWSESTSQLSVVMPADLPRPGAPDPLPSFWMDRTLPQAGLPATALADAAFAIGGQAPVRLVSLVDTTPAGTNAFTIGSRLASDDPAGGGAHPFVPLTYATSQDPARVGDAVLARDGGSAVTDAVLIPGTRFVPKILITNDPGPAFTPGMVTVAGTPIARVGRITLDGKVYETDANGQRLIRDLPGTGFESAGDLRNVALKIVSFDTQSVFQDSPRAKNNFGNSFILGVCSAAVAGSCLDDPTYAVATSFNDTPRIVYPDSATAARCNPASCGQGSDPNGNPVTHVNPVSPGYQAAGYLSSTCVATGTCLRPAPSDPVLAFYAQGEQPLAGSNPNALSSSLAWSGAQPGAASAGRFEFFNSLAAGATIGRPFLIPDIDFSFVLGLSEQGSQRGATFKIGASLTQTPVQKTLDAPAPSRITLAVNHGIAGGVGIASSTDGTNAFKSSLPAASVSSADNTGAPAFSTIVPTVLDVSAGATTIAGAGALPGAQVTFVPNESLTSALLGKEPAMLEPVAVSGSSTPPAAPAANADAPAPRLLLGGRGLAQSVDLGRGGPLGGAAPLPGRLEHQVACAADTLPGPLRTLPPCR